MLQRRLEKALSVGNDTSEDYNFSEYWHRLCLEVHQELEGLLAETMEDIPMRHAETVYKTESLMQDERARVLMERLPREEAKEVEMLLLEKERKLSKAFEQVTYLLILLYTDFHTFSSIPYS